MQIRPVDVHDDAQFHSFYETLVASRSHERPMAIVPSEAESKVAYRRPHPNERREPFAVFEDATVVGAATMDFPLRDNTDKVYVSIDVPPVHRRRGIGTALVERVLTRAAAEQRRVVIVDAHYPIDAGEDHPYRRFAHRHGFSVGNTELQRVLELPVPDETLQGWIDECAPHHERYRIETYVESIPPALLPSYVQLVNRLALDAPTGDLDFEAEALTVEGFLESEQTLKEQGRTVYATVASIGDGADATAVAHSVIAVPPPGADEPNLYQWATLVAPEHRGHRLGFACKAANLRAVQKAHPDRTRLQTSNSPENGPMVAINERMGFRAYEVNAELVRRL